jgi:aspartyl-tRNA(Asn)/glutamyl-tRNA(Gln) amidotransferase subunit A
MDEFGMGSLGTNSRSVTGEPLLTKNPLPYLRKLRLDESVGEKSIDETIAEIIRLPQDFIIEKHAEAFDGKDAIFSAGGSSCGSAASVAHGSALLSLGTDTGGSVRLPSAWCGLVGLKPSYGLLSRHGVVSYASSFDTVGILAKSVDCATLSLDVLAQRGGASRDSTFSSYRSLDFVPELLGNTNVRKDDNPLSGIRVGIPCAFSVEECPPEIKSAWSNAAEWLQQHGASIEEISVDDIAPDLVKTALSAYYVLVCAEASSNLSRYDGFRYGVPAETTVLSDADADSDMTLLERQYSATRKQGFGTEVARRILCGTSVLSSDRFHTHYEAAAKLRAALSRQLHTVLRDKVDLLLIPTALSLPCRIDEDDIDSTVMFANDIMTVPPSLAGLPSVSVPIRIEGEEIFMGSLQLIGPRLREDIVLKAGNVLEAASYEVSKT